ncbi:hypothetical protein BDR22DRAFT_864542 [Usnea florida]
MALRFRRPLLIISVDFGTTYSAVAHALLHPDQRTTGTRLGLFPTDYLYWNHVLRCCACSAVSKSANDRYQTRPISNGLPSCHAIPIRSKRKHSQRGPSENRTFSREVK